MITIKQRGDFKKLDKYFKKSIKITRYENVEQIARDCVDRLKEATPKDSGLTSESWSYIIIERKNSKTIQINNTNIQNGVNVALILEYGHGTRNGSWIEGRNYIAPVIERLYLDIIDKAWKELRNL
jgi:hypothetical protein